MTESKSLCESLRWRADRVHSRGHKCPSPPCPFEEEATELRAAADEIDRVTAENGRLRLELRLPGPNPPEGYFDV